MKSGISPFFWVISTGLALLAIAINYFGLQIPMGNVLLAGGGPFDVLLIAYIVLWIGGAINAS
jgi:hypothetical protein